MGVNFYTSVRNYRESGQKMSFGDLFDFSDALDKIIGPIIVGVLIFLGYICLIIPGIILTFMWAHMNVRIIPGMMRQIYPKKINTPTIIGPMILSRASEKSNKSPNDIF